jgi:hypothetical protein
VTATPGRRPLRPTLYALLVLAVVAAALVLGTQPLLRADESARALPDRSARGFGDRHVVAEDDFTGASPDGARWRLYDVTSPIGARWSPSMVRVVGGELRIIGAGRNPTGAGNLSGGLCWCGPDGNRTYGIWQVRAKFDPGAGYGQIIGLWPQSDNGADGTVTFAAAREADKSIARAYVMWNGHDSDERTVAGDFTGWHTYTLEWRASYLKVKVDDTTLYDSTTSRQGVIIPRVPMHLFMQQPVGPYEDVPAADVNTPDQVIMHIDWVRMYP